MTLLYHSSNTTVEHPDILYSQSLHFVESIQLFE